MSNRDDILKRILLNMKYDSSKTLSENKKIKLNEQPWAEDLSKKKPTIKIDPAEMGSIGQFDGGQYQVGGQIEKKSTRKYFTDVAANGSELVLPIGSKILSRRQEGTKPAGIENYCKLLMTDEDKLSQEKINQCKEYVQNLYNTKRTIGGVSSFTTGDDNKTYKACWRLSDGKNVVPLNSQTFFSGYFTVCYPPGEQYNNPKGVDTEINISKDTGSDSGVEGGMNVGGSGQTIKVFLRGPK